MIPTPVRIQESLAILVGRNPGRRGLGILEPDERNSVRIPRHASLTGARPDHPAASQPMRLHHLGRRDIQAQEIGMQPQVSILHHDYPTRAREQVEQKLQHLVKFYDRIVSMRALLERQHDEHRVEIVAHIGRGAVLVVDARASAFAAALEEAIERMERLLKRQHDKRSHSRRRGRPAD